MKVMIKPPSSEDWSRLINEGLNFNGQTNTKYNFGAMSKRFGLAYIYYLNLAWIIKDNLTNQELRYFWG